MNWIKNISDTINKVFGTARMPLTDIPPILLLCEIMNRPGLSAIALAGATIARCQNEGIPTENMECGEQNHNNKFIKIVAEEVIRHIKMSAVTETVAKPGDLTFIGTGGNAGGPITMTLMNNNMGKFGGIVE